MYDIYVIADNCTDHTPDVCKPTVPMRMYSYEWSK